jgi:hypothetical protein
MDPLHDSSPRPDRAPDWRGEFKDLAAGFARFGMWVALGCLAPLTLISILPAPDIAWMLAYGVAWAALLLACAAFAVSGGVLLWGAFQSRLERQSLLTLAGALLFFAVFASLVFLRAS